MVGSHRLVCYFELSQEIKQRLFVAQNVTFGQMVVIISFVEYRSQLFMTVSLVLLDFEAVE